MATEEEVVDYAAGAAGAPKSAAVYGGVDGGWTEEADEFISAIMAGMGDACVIDVSTTTSARVTQDGLRIVRGLEPEDRDTLLTCWIELWRGAIHSGRTFLDVDCAITETSLIWTIAPDAR